MQASTWTLLSNTGRNPEFVTPFEDTYVPMAGTFGGHQKRAQNDPYYGENIDTSTKRQLTEV